MELNLIDFLEAMLKPSKHSESVHDSIITGLEDCGYQYNYQTGKILPRHVRQNTGQMIDVLTSLYKDGNDQPSPKEIEAYKKGLTDAYNILNIN